LRLPKLEDQVPVFIFPRNRVAQIYPRALGFLSVPSHDSQGYGGSILSRLHTGFNFNCFRVVFFPVKTLFYGVVTDMRPNCCIQVTNPANIAVDKTVKRP
jgi:hypothetical protein